MNNNISPGDEPNPMVRKTAYLGLGGNIGDVKSNLQKALEFLKTSNEVEIICASAIYETPPWGIQDQPVFLNICIQIKTRLMPIELLDLCHRIEHALKRERTIRWGPRTIDIDILLMEGENVNLPDLIIPHPRIKERAFVLVPLADIAPEWVLDGRSIASWRQLCGDEGVKQVFGRDVFDDVVSKQAKT